MKQLIGNFTKKTYISLFAIPLLLISLKAQAETTVVVDSNDKVVAIQPAGYVQTVAAPVIITPVVVTREVAVAQSFEGRVVDINYAQYQILIQDPNGINRQVMVKPEMINNYRIGDYVQVRPAADITIITIEENPKDFEGEIIRVDMSEGQLVVLDTNGRERRVQLKQGMIATYKVDDYVRIHLMADMKEAKTIETIRDVRSLDGSIVRTDFSRSQMVLRDTHGAETTVLVRQGQISNYRVGDRVHVYLLSNHEQVQVIRVIR